MAVILTRPLYGAYLDKDVVLTRLTAEKEYKEKTLSALTTMEKSLSQGATASTDLIKKIKKISKKWDTSDIMSTVMLNKFTLTNQFNRANISIGSITVDPGSKLPN